jgi:hypothetical protein
MYIKYYILLSINYPHQTFIKQYFVWKYLFNLATFALSKLAQPVISPNTFHYNKYYLLKYETHVQKVLFYVIQVSNMRQKEECRSPTPLDLSNTYFLKQKIVSE